MSRGSERAPPESVRERIESEEERHEQAANRRQAIWGGTESRKDTAKARVSCAFRRKLTGVNVDDELALTVDALKESMR